MRLVEGCNWIIRWDNRNSSSLQRIKQRQVIHCQLLYKFSGKAKTNKTSWSCCQTKRYWAFISKTAAGIDIHNPIETVSPDLEDAWQTMIYVPRLLDGFIFTNFYLAITYFSRHYKCNDAKGVVEEHTFKIKLVNQLFMFKDVSAKGFTISCCATDIG